MTRIFHKIHRNVLGDVFAACDRELLGKTLEEGEIHFEVRESFYGTEPLSVERLAELLHEFGNVNLVGKKCVGIAIKKGFASESNTIRIKNVPHLQIFRI